MFGRVVLAAWLLVVLLPGTMAEEKTPTRWGFDGGTQFAIWPSGFRGGDGGPRGLIRVGFPVLDGGKKYDLVQFIAIEPVVRGKKGFSELERGHDGKAGKLITARETKEGIVLDVEKFDNGAHVSVVATQFRERSGEIVFTVHALPDSAPLEYATLSATMGNYARLRELRLKDKIVNSRQLYPDYKGDGFTPDKIFTLNQLDRNHDGSVIVMLGTDEREPAAVHPFHNADHWYYGGAPLTQYWRVPRDAFRDDLHLRVNARRVYWASQTEIPNGVSFENFELREKFYDGQQFIFGLLAPIP